MRQGRHRQWHAAKAVDIGTPWERGAGAAVRRQGLAAVFGRHGIPRDRPFFGSQPHCRLLLGQVLRQGNRIDPQFGHRSQGGGNGRTAQLCRA